MTKLKELAKIVESITLNISTTCRSGTNGLRNADEIVQAVLDAIPMVILPYGSQAEIGDLVKVTCEVRNPAKKWGVLSNKTGMSISVDGISIPKDDIKNIEIHKRNGVAVYMEGKK